ncbi:MAG: glycosyltransferase involved in cell wall biosynthesis, partial [Francisellaceae bacterium]
MVYLVCNYKYCGVKTLIFLIDLPNPTHGMSNVNLAILTEFSKSNQKVKTINTVPSYAANFFTSRFWGVFKICHTLFCFLHFFVSSTFNLGGVVYRPINGGYGQLYDLIYILMCRLFKNKIYIHHHSFDYLNSRSPLFEILNKLAGKCSTHIVLGKKMGTLLTELYGVKEENIKIVSNLAFFEVQPPDKSVKNDTKIKVGHLANLCIEKGVDIFINICRSLHSNKINFSAVIAGPCVDDTTKKLVLDAVKELPQLRYVGPLYAE